MSERLIQELSGENLCTHFVLPLIKLSKFSFVKSNFINSYLSKDAKLIAVKIYSEEFLTRKVFEIHEYVGKTVREDGYLYLHYDIPFRWKRDVGLFMEGRFSKMSENAKALIKQYSGLEYKSIQHGQTITDGRLLALDRDPALRVMWEQRIGVPVGDEDELLTKPGPESYFDLDLNKKSSL